MKIKGLIRAFDSIRAQMLAGIRPEDAARFRATVTNLIADVEHLCARSGARPRDLPSPSRRAYASLKSIDLDNLALATDIDGTPRPTKVKLQNVVSAGTYYADLFWRQTLRPAADDPGVTSHVSSLQTHVEGIEMVCSDQGGHPSNLPSPSRQSYAWLKFLADETTLTSHLKALARVRNVISIHYPSRLSDTTVHLIKTGNTLWKSKGSRNGAFLKVSQGFMHAGEEIWQALVQGVFVRRSARASGIVHRYADTKSYTTVIRAMEAHITVDTRATRGNAHDLDASFDRINVVYFGGNMEKPILTWNRIPTGRLFGQYDGTRDQVMLSITMDDPKVPEWVLDFVMYHELLHKKHGTSHINGRRMSHTSAFKADERRYAKYAEAEAHIKRLAFQ